MSTIELREEVFKSINPILDDDKLMVKLLEIIRFIAPSKTKSATSKTENDTTHNFFDLYGTWANDSEGEEYYQMMIHRNDERPANREILSFD